MKVLGSTAHEIFYASQDLKPQQQSVHAICIIFLLGLPAAMNSFLSILALIVSALIDCALRQCRDVILTGESHMLIVERIPSNNGVQVVSSSGGVARDTVTVVRARYSVPRL